MSLKLLDEFNSIARMLGETSEAVERVIGPNPEVTRLLRAARDMLTEGLFSGIHLRRLCSTDQSVIDYLVATMGMQPVERLRVLFLDRGDHLIGDEIMASGSITSLTAYPRVIFKRALELSAVSIVLVHNHPGGSVEPSASDIEFTNRLIAAGQPLELHVQDHIIIAGTRWFSFSRRGLL